MNFIHIIIFLLLFIGILLIIGLFHSNIVESLDSMEYNKLGIPIEPLFLNVKNDFLNSDLAQDFCKTLKNSNSLNYSNSSNFTTESVSQSNSLEYKCNNLTSSNCFSTDCCVLVNGNKCVAGSKNGPTYLTDENGTKKNMDFYYYQGKCYGKKCPN